ncbi:hypothetical protein [Agrobacterium tumefaciens]|uniref:hypothetical protein n=1 Tax=Agrobacterium tumefaciens TaxID=358 RepID=UPI003BA337EF
MTPEEIARANQFREGFTLVDYAEVGLPVFRLTIEAVTTAQRVLPTIHEFVMRCLALGETREEVVARMLGLRTDVVVAAVNALVGDGYVTRHANGLDLQSFGLTEAGEARLALERMEVPQEEMLVIDYDGIRRVPIRLAGTSVLRSAELRTAGALEIRPYPAEPPSIESLAIPDVTRVIRRQGGEDFKRTVLALKRIVRRNNVYREAVALVFSADHGTEVQVAFAIDGKLSEHHERAFAEHGGPKKMGFLKALGQTDTTRQLERFIGKQTIRSYPSKTELRSLREAEAEAEATIRETAPVAERGGKASPAKVTVSSAKDSLDLAIRQLAAYPVRPLECYEQQFLLVEAMEKAQSRLFVTTNGIQPALFHGFLLRQVDRLLEEGVAVQIERQPSSSEQARDDSRYDPVKELQKRKHRGTPVLTTGLKRPLYFLVKDTDLAVVSNRPFFGEPFRRSSFMFISGIVVRSPESVEAIYQKVIETPARKRD